MRDNHISGGNLFLPQVENLNTRHRRAAMLFLSNIAMTHLAGVGLLLDS
jgi:hypothetical protein